MGSPFALTMRGLFGSAAYRRTSRRTTATSSFVPPRLLQRTFHVRQGVEITLDKQIPIAAGLGGGSSDAATTLLVLNHVWQLNSARSTLHPLAAQLGSDVPFFLGGPNSTACGRGEVLSPVTSSATIDGDIGEPGVRCAGGLGLWAIHRAVICNGPDHIPAFYRRLETRIWRC